MASTAKSAVSDYEHLKYRFGEENQIHVLDSEDEDFIPLKSKAKVAHDEGFASIFESHKQNKRGPMFKSFSSENKLDSVNFYSIESAPEPLAWSPGMIIKPNPSLIITPEKRVKTSRVEIVPENDILEPRDLNQVPTPVTWSPHPMLKPSIHITPDKYADTPSDCKEGLSHKSSLQMDTAKSKEKLTVRFELPSISSGDEFMDSSALSDSESPVTIRGKDLPAQSGEEGDHLFHSSCRVYNPMIYSDESFMDDSNVENSKDADESDKVSLSTSANLVDKLGRLLESSNNLKENSLATTSNQISQLSNSVYNMGQSNDLPKKVLRSTELSYNFSKEMNKNPSTERRKPLITSSEAKISKKKLHPDKSSKPGPHHLNSSISPYHPPSSGVCVVREVKHPMISTDYSYPFNGVQDVQEYEHAFSRPEFNSTMKVRSELDKLCDQEIDVQKAVEVQLSKSSSKRTEIQEKAAVFTNHVSDQFNNLVDVEPSIDRLCDRVVRMRMCGKAPSHKRVKKDRKEISGQTAPDLMEFYSEDLQKESPDLSLPGFVHATPDLISAPHDQAFDCYRHNRLWSGLQDF